METTLKIIPDVIRKAVQQMIFPSAGLSLLTLPRTGYDYGRQVNGYQSAIIMACANWIQRTFPEAPLYLRQRNQDGSWDDKFDHPMLSLVDSPNPYYDGLLLQMATIADYTIDGNAYWRKIRSAAGRVVQLWWIPSMFIEPAWGYGTTEYLSHYDYSPGGISEKVDPADIVHFRYGLDPNNIRKGLSPLKSLFREVFTDNEAANMTASLLRNLGVPGIVISPKEGAPGFKTEAGKEIKEWFKETTTGDKRGEPLVMSGSTHVEQFGFNPQQMDLRALRQIPEERISGVLGVPAIVAGLGAGLARSTFANMQEAREMAYESNIIPSQRVFGSVMKRQLLGEFEDDVTPWQVVYDLSEVRVLQEDENKKAERVSGMVTAGYVTVEDAQRETNMPVDPSQKVYLRPMMVIEVLAGQVPGVRVEEEETDSLSVAPELKSEGLTEEMKAILWKRVDQQRVAWWSPASKQILPLYEDEDNAVAKAIKGKAPDKLVAAAEKAINSLKSDWEAMMVKLSAAIVKDFGEDTAEAWGATKADVSPAIERVYEYLTPETKAWSFDPTDAAIRKWIEEEATKDIVSILATNLDDVKRVILAGVDENIGTTQIAKNLRQFYSDRSPFKAMRVARTEVTKASAFGSQEAAKQSGVVKTKTWLSSRDDRVREEHEAMDGETVKLDEVFSNGLEYPSEPMCRCVLAFGTR